MEFYFTFQGLDFAPPLIVPNANAEIKNATICSDQDPLSKYACLVKSMNFGSGTGVVIAVRDNPINIGGNSIRALVATAGHVTGRILGSNDSFSIKIDKLKCEAYLIKEFADWKSRPQKDEITNCSYILPNNISLLGVADLTPTTREAEIESDFRRGDQIFVVGIPQKPTLISYCAPILKDDAHYKDKITKAFCGFTGDLVKSDGIVMSNSSSELIMGNYSATSGMSGGPVFSQDEKLLGINVGGASIAFQYEVGQLISLGKDGFWDNAKDYFKNLKGDIANSNMFDMNQRHLIVSLSHVNAALKVADFEILVKACTYLLQALAIGFKEPLALDHNLAISCTNPILVKLKATVNLFKSMPASFASMDQFAGYLSL